MNTPRRLFLSSVAGLAAAGSASRLSASQSTPLPSSDVSRTSDRYILPRKVLLWESTRKEIREALEDGRLKAAIVPTGSTEQHNEALAMIQDTASAVLIAQQAALQLYPQVIVSTPRAGGHLTLLDGSQRDSHAASGDLLGHGLRHLRQPPAARYQDHLYRQRARRERPATQDSHG